MSDTQDSQHFLDYWRIVYARKEIVIGVALLVIVSAFAITMWQPKVYMASTRIAVRRDTLEMAIQQPQASLMMGSYDPYFLRTQFEIIQSRPILYEVINKLDLCKHFGRLYSDTMTPLALQDAYKHLSQSMKVQQYRDTNLIEIRIKRSTKRTSSQVAREDAERIANMVAQVYLDQRMKSIRDEKDRGLLALREANAKQQKEVEAAEKRLETLRLELGVTDIGSARQDNVNTLDKERLHQIELDRVAARNKMIERRTMLEKIEKLQGDELLYSAAYLLKDPALASLRDQVNDAEIKVKMLMENYGGKHPQVISAMAAVTDARKKIDETLKGIKLSLQTDVEISTKAYEAVEADMAAAKKSDISDHTERYLPFNKAENELLRVRQVRDALESRLKLEQIEYNLPRTPVEVVDRAEMPDENDFVSPILLMNLILGVIAGMGAGVGLAFLIEYFDTSVKTVDDIERFLGTTILGVIPQKVKPLIDEGPESRHAEAYRVLRTNIQFSKKFVDGRTLCLTSGGAGEGKSLTASNLAFIFAHAGQKVLLVDGDMRRPTQHKLFSLSNQAGFADVLMDRMTPEAAICQSSVGNLDIILSGKLPSVAHGIMTTQRVRDMIATLKPLYEVIIFDTPPIMGVSDASIIASEVDGVLLVIQHRSYPRAMSARAKAMVENVGGNLVGVVLNNININRDYYYYYHSYYYYGSDRKGHRPKKSVAMADKPPRQVPPKQG